MKIIHAVCNENGEAHGGIAGDQTGKEIREANWYVRSGGWEQYIECEDPKLAEHAVTIAKAICAGNYGYNQDARWTGYDSICTSGIENGRGDFDCSSLVLSCYRLAGLNIKEKSGSTRDVAKILCSTGKFKLYTDSEHLTSADYAKKGSLFCTPAKHIIICIDDGKLADHSEPVEYDAPAMRIRAKGSVRIREAPKTGRTIAIAHKGDVLEVFGTDESSGWYQTATGYITNKERYVEIV